VGGTLISTVRKARATEGLQKGEKSPSGDPYKKKERVTCRGALLGRANGQGSETGGTRVPKSEVQEQEIRRHKADKSSESRGVSYGSNQGFLAEVLPIRDAGGRRGGIIGRPSR